MSPYWKVHDTNYSNQNRIRLVRREENLDYGQ